MPSAELDVALSASRLPDSEGRPPSDPDFVEENWDLNYAAAEGYELKQAKFSASWALTEFSAENARFKKNPPNFLALVNYYRDKSTVGDAGQPTFVEIDSREPYRLRPRSLWRGDDG